MLPQLLSPILTLPPPITSPLTPLVTFLPPLPLSLIIQLTLMLQVLMPPRLP